MPQKNDEEQERIYKEQLIELKNKYPDNDDYAELFWNLWVEIKNDALSLQLADFDSVNIYFNTQGNLETDISGIIHAEDASKRVPITYDGHKYMYLNEINEGESLVVLYIGVDDHNGAGKRGLFITEFYGLYLIAGIDHEAMAAHSNKIMNIISTFGEEEAEE